MDGVRTLCHKKDLLKVMVACGLAQAGMTGTDLILPVLAGKMWGEKMASIGSAVMAIRFFVQLLATPFFGRWCDRVQRKWAFLVMGFAIWVPIWPFLILGPTETALWAGAFLKIISAIAGSTAVGYALVNDYTTREERTSVMAIGTAGMLFVEWIPKLLAAWVMKTHPKHILAPIYCDLSAMCIFILFALWIGLPCCPTGKSKESNEMAYQSDAATAATGMPVKGRTTSASVSTNTTASPSDMGRDHSDRSDTWDSAERDADIDAEAGLAAAGPANVLGRSNFRANPMDRTSTKNPVKMVWETLTLMCGNKTLVKVCIIFTMISLPEVSESEVTTMYAFRAMGVFTGTNTVSMSDIVFTLNYTQMGSACLWCTMAGIIAKRIGLVNFLRGLIPVAAAVQLSPLLYGNWPSLGHVALASFLSPLAWVPGIPLNTIVMLCAPHHRMAEALCAISMCKALSALVGSCLVPPIIAVAGTQQLALFYMLGCVSTCLSWPVSWCLEEPSVHEHHDHDQVQSKSSDESATETGESCDESTSSDFDSNNHQKATQGHVRA